MLPIESAKEGFKGVFLQDGLCMAHQIQLPEVFLPSEGGANSGDHCFHEFDSVESTLEEPTDLHLRSIRNSL